MKRYMIQQLGRLRRYRYEDWETEREAILWADSVVDAWRRAGYRGGAQLVELRQHGEARCNHLVEVYGRGTAPAGAAGYRTVGGAGPDGRSKHERD